MKIFKYILLIIIVVSGYFYGSIGVGYITIRNVLALLLLLYWLFTTPKPKTNTVFVWFIIYLLSHLLMNLINGEIFIFSFWKTFLSYHLVSIAFFLGLLSMIKTKSELRCVISVIIIFTLINCIVTILQFYNNPIAWIIGDFISKTDVGAEDYLANHHLDTFINAAIAYGIMGNVVVNGYFMASMLPIVTYSIWSKKIKSRIIGYIVLAACLYCMFCIQQRMAALCTILFISVVLFKKTTRKPLIWVPIFVIVLGFAINMIDFSQIDAGRFSIDVDNSARTSLFNQFLQYLGSGDALIGGYDKYCSLYGEQHNTFLDVITRDGLIGLPVFVVYFFVSFNYYVGYAKQKMSILTLCGYAGLIFMLYSQTHSSGIQSGFSIFWLINLLLILSNRTGYLLDD